jgi:hypothetical protein
MAMELLDTLLPDPLIPAPFQDIQRQLRCFNFSWDVLTFGMVNCLPDAFLGFVFNEIYIDNVSQTSSSATT